MSRYRNSEVQGSNDWKIFQAANKRVTAANARFKHIKSLKTYENYVQFLEEEKQESLKKEYSSTDEESLYGETQNENGTGANDDVQNSTNDIGEPEKLSSNHADPDNPEDNDGDELETDEASSSRKSSPSVVPESIRSSCSDYVQSDSWESLSDSSEDQNLEDYMKSVASRKDGKGERPEEVKANIRRRKKTKDSRCLPYRNLRDSMITDFLNSDNMKERSYPNAEAIKVNKFLDENLPLIQVLDVMEDIDKVLKVGKLTPRMERIMEYKQTHPFEFGYEEDEMGCCPWLWFKIQSILDRFWATQWPFYINA